METRTVTVEGCRRVQAEMMVEAGQRPSWGEGVGLGFGLGITVTLLVQLLLMLAVMNSALGRKPWRFW